MKRQLSSLKLPDQGRDAVQRHLVQHARGYLLEMSNPLFYFAALRAHEERNLTFVGLFPKRRAAIAAASLRFGCFEDKAVSNAARFGHRSPYRGIHRFAAEIDKASAIGTLALIAVT